MRRLLIIISRDDFTIALYADTSQEIASSYRRTTSHHKLNDGVGEDVRLKYSGTAI